MGLAIQTYVVRMCGLGECQKRKKMSRECRKCNELEFIWINGLGETWKINNEKNENEKNALTGSVLHHGWSLLSQFLLEFWLDFRIRTLGVNFEISSSVFGFWNVELVLRNQSGITYSQTFSGISCSGIRYAPYDSRMSGGIWNRQTICWTRPNGSCVMDVRFLILFDLARRSFRPTAFIRRGVLGNWRSRPVASGRHLGRHKKYRGRVTFGSKD